MTTSTSSEGVIRSISSLINVIDAISFKLTIDRTRMSGGVLKSMLTLNEAIIDVKEG